MPLEEWGLTGAWRVSGVAPTLLLIFYLVLVFLLLARQRHAFRRRSARSWAWIVGLWLAGFLASQLLPITLSFSAQLPPPGATRIPVTSLTVLTALPLLLAGLVYGPAVALVAGLFTGFGQLLTPGGQVFDLFHLALAGWLAGSWLWQDYDARLYHWLRQPVVTGTLVMTLVAPLLGLATLCSALADGSLIAIDLALSTMWANFLPSAIEGFVGGLVVTLIVTTVPQLRAQLHLQPQLHLRPSPAQRSLTRRLLSSYTRFAILLTVTMVALVATGSTYLSRQLVAGQMAQNARTVSAEIPDFQGRLQNLLVQHSQDLSLLSAEDVDHEKSLRQLYRTSPFYRRVLLVGPDAQVSAYYPEDRTSVTLTELEQAAVSAVFATSAPNITSAQTRQDEHVLSFAVPVLDAGDKPAAVLIGRVPDLSLANLIVGLQGTVGQGSGFVVDEAGRIIAHPDANRLLTYWVPPVPSAQPGSQAAADGVLYQGIQASTNARELVYYLSGDDHPWTVVITVPYAVVLRLALSISLPLTALLLVLTTGFYVQLSAEGRKITRPLQSLVQASRTIAAGGQVDLEEEEALQREDELGQLGQAFVQMQRSLKGRVDELSLLLSVSTDVSTSININESMPAVLKGALRGTGATGARAIVFTPGVGTPLTYGEGPAADAMRSLDRAIATRLRGARRLTLSTPEQIRAELELASDVPLPVPALVAFALVTQERFQGVLWLGYRQSHRFTAAEQNLLSTLVGQAAVLVENARLFATADGGWRRLHSVLASTTNAVIVTDQAQRVLLINRAMERTFGLSMNSVAGRQVQDVITVPPLLRALSEDDGPSTSEFTTNDRTYFTNAAPIISNDGQAMGRVAVLHDITYFKELDKLKTEFVDTLSHDLRSPLAAIRSIVAMLPLSGDVNDEQQQYMDRLLGLVDRMSAMIEGLMSLKSIEAGVQMSFGPVDLQALLQGIAEDYWSHLHMSNLTMKLALPAALPLVYGDASLIRQAVVNYLDNAIKYAPQSGELVLRAAQLGDEVQIGVQDQGPGISTDTQMRLFEKFYRAKERGTEHIKGTGLGLAIVKSIAAKHGGRAWCQSQPGRGSTFFVSLPVLPPDAGADNPAPARPDRRS